LFAAYGGLNVGKIHHSGRHHTFSERSCRRSLKKRKKKKGKKSNEEQKRNQPQNKERNKANKNSFFFSPPGNTFSSLGQKPTNPHS
jgi:hypothetical protein